MTAENNKRRVIPYTPRVKNQEPLTYEELRLGNRAKEVFRANGGGRIGLDAISGFPTYTNSRVAFGNLDTTDLVIAGILAGMNTCLIGSSGKGKSQVAEDISNYYFGGKVSEGGNSAIITGSNDLQSIDDFFMRWNPLTQQFEFNGNQNAVFHDIEEFNRCIDYVQNQLYSVLNGRFIGKSGSQTYLGKDGFLSLIATANDPRHTDGQGTFPTGEALWNRFGVILNPTNPLYKPTEADNNFIDEDLQGSGVLRAKPRDLTDKIVKASKQISSTATISQMGVEAQTMYNLIRQGLANCPTKGQKSNGVWYENCAECPSTSSLCGKLRNPTNPRMLRNIVQYAQALDFLSKLKDSSVQIPQHELILRAFELNSAYQPGVLNPNVLASADYSNDNHKMMRDVVNQLRSEFESERGQRLCAVIENARAGNDTKFYKFNGKEKTYACDPKQISEQKEFLEEIDPKFDNKGPVGYGWIPDYSNDRRELNSGDN